jgi:hypothetical protein
MLPADAPAELDLPAFDARALARRAALPVAALVVAAGVLIFAGGPMHAFSNALHRAIDADPRWVLAAVGFEVISFSGYIALLWMVGERATPRMDLRASAEVTLAGAAVTRLLPTGGAGGVALTLWALRRTGLESKQATRTLLTFLVLLYAVFLLSIAAPGALLAVGLGGEGGHVLFAAFAGVGATVAMGLAVASMSSARARTPAASAAPPPRSARACAAPTRSCARPTSACSAPRCGGRSTRPCSTGCSTRSARRPRSRSSCSATSSAWSPTRSRSPARSAAAWSACCWRSASRPTSRSPPSSPTARSRSGSPPPSASPPSAACAAPSPAGAPRRPASPSPRRSRRPALGARAGPQPGMSYAPTPAATGNGHRVALLGIGLVGAALFTLVQAGVIAPPDLEGALTDLSDTLGAWTYLLVGGSRSSRPARSSG